MRVWSLGWWKGYFSLDQTWDGVPLSLSSKKKITFWTIVRRWPIQLGLILAPQECASIFDNFWKLRFSTFGVVVEAIAEFISRLTKFWKSYKLADLWISLILLASENAVKPNSGKLRIFWQILNWNCGFSIPIVIDRTYGTFPCF